MRKDQYLLFFGIGCILAAIAVYSINYFACEEKESPSEVIAISRASMYGLRSYQSETTSTFQSNAGTITTTSTKDYAAPEGYHGKSIKGDEWLEYIFVDGKQYYRASYGEEWRDRGIFYKDDGSVSQIFMQISDDFKVMGTIRDVETLSGEKIGGVSCHHYRDTQYPEIDIEAEMEKFETYLAENPQLLAGTQAMSLEEMKEQVRAQLQMRAEGETIIDLWIGKDDYFLRQMKMVTNFINPGNDGEGEWATTTVTTEWTGFNEPLVIVAPEVGWVPPEAMQTPAMETGTSSLESHPLNRP